MTTRPAPPAPPARAHRARRSALPALAAAALLAPAAHAIINGTPAPASDRRLDCVGLIKGLGCDPWGISGSCILIDPGLRRDGTLVRGALVLVADHSLVRSWGGFKCRFRRGADGSDDGDYPAGATADHCAGHYQEGALRFVNGLPRVTFPDTAPGAPSVGLAVIELDTVIVNIRPAAIDPSPPWALTAGTPLLTAGWGATDAAGTQGLWALRTAPVRVRPAPTACPIPCTAAPACEACSALTLCAAAGPGDTTCAGLASQHDSGSAVFRVVPNPDSDEASLAGGDLVLVGIGGTPPQLTPGACYTFVTTPWAWNAAVHAALPLPAGAPPHAGGLSDFDRDGATDILDLFAFLGAWFDGLSAADVAAPAGCDLTDVFVFMQGWFAGR